jgi:hypothetical protein
MAEFPSSSVADGVWSLKQQRRALLGSAWPVVVLTDEYFANVSLLLHGDGTDGSTTFTDSSSNNATMVVSGTVSNSTTESKFGSGSILFGGDRDWIYPSDHTPFIFGTNDFTIEMWIYPFDFNVGRHLYDDRAGGNGAHITWQIGSDGLLYYIANAAVQRVGTTVVPTNTWSHVALCRSGNSTKMFLNGVQESTTYNDTTDYTTVSGKPRIGANSFLTNESLDFYGYMDDIRITKGVARYTANFTPPTEPFPDQ